MTFVRQIARKVTVLHQGTVLCEGSVEEVQNDERVIEVYLGRKKEKNRATVSTALAILTLVRLHAAYEGSRILRGVTLKVPERLVVSLMGRNGVGKTTTLKCIMGLVKPTSGDIRLGTRSWPAPRRARAPRARLRAARPRYFSQPDGLGKSEDQPGRNGAKANGQVDRVLELFPVLKEMLQRKGGVLSGGQQQQLAIARALLDRSEGPAPGRAHRRHPAQHHRPDRRDASQNQAGRKNQHPARRTISGFLPERGDSFYIMDRGAMAAEGPIADLNRHGEAIFDRMTLPQAPGQRPIARQGGGRPEHRHFGPGHQPAQAAGAASRGPSVWAYLSSLGGGLVPGDQIALSISLGEGARAYLGTQASTKVYRNPRASLQPAPARPISIAAPSWRCAGPVQSFGGSHYSQQQEFRLHPDSGLVLVDWLFPGVPRGENVGFRVTRAGTRSRSADARAGGLAGAGPRRRTPGGPIAWGASTAWRW